MNMMLEMGIFELDGNNCLYVPQNPPKVNLEESGVMKKLRSVKV